MMNLNNSLVNIIETNPDNIYVLENDNWIISSEAQMGNSYAMWYSFFGIMKVEFKNAREKINKLKDHTVKRRALECFSTMSKITYNFLFKKCLIES